MSVLSFVFLFFQKKKIYLKKPRSLLTKGNNPITRALLIAFVTNLCCFARRNTQTCTQNSFNTADVSGSATLGLEHTTHLADMPANAASTSPAMAARVVLAQAVATASAPFPHLRRLLSKLAGSAVYSCSMAPVLAALCRLGGIRREAYRV